MNETNLIKSLYKHFANYDYKLSNVFIYNWESDFFAISTSGYTVEVEVKISKSDFKADFKKTEKHRMLANASKDIVTVGVRLNDEMSYVNYKIPKTPNKFYYYCPDGIIDLKDVPDYAGLLYFNPEGDDYTLIKEVKSAKFLHKNKPDISKILLEKYYWMYNNLKSDYRQLLWRMRDMEKMLEWSPINGNQKHKIEEKYYEPKLFNL